VNQQIFYRESYILSECRDFIFEQIAFTDINEIRMLDFRKIINLVASRCDTKGPHNPDFGPIIAKDE